MQEAAGPQAERHAVTQSWHDTKSCGCIGILYRSCKMGWIEAPGRRAMCWVDTRGTRVCRKVVSSPVAGRSMGDSWQATANWTSQRRANDERCNCAHRLWRCELSLREARGAPDSHRAAAIADTTWPVSYRGPKKELHTTARSGGRGRSCSFWTATRQGKCDGSLVLVTSIPLAQA
ncbi:hypothetical protein LZ30DRAFT_188314 [Colletotrichum cereale]|nr:hypothetical protein LZ30DRAFT_188314 [Colletotrichum cereale]